MTFTRGGGPEWPCRLSSSREVPQEPLEHIEERTHLRVGHRHRQTATATGGEEYAVIESVQKEFVRQGFIRTRGAAIVGDGLGGPMDAEQRPSPRDLYRDSIASAQPLQAQPKVAALLIEVIICRRT